MNRAACFLDRDGVVIEQICYLSDPAQVRLLPGSARAISRLNARRIPVVVATNQAGVAHGFFQEHQIAEVHRRLDQLLAAEGAFIDHYYHCPHHPRAEVAAFRADCECRKPAPGMLLRAAAELGLDLKRSYLVGDKLSDIEAGLRAGCKVALTLTGYGAVEARSLGMLDPAAVAVVADLEEAVDICLPELTEIPKAA
jgi:D-glycero-D-manno-heptose 1,7-bisphosphate phosphatase